MSFLYFNQSGKDSSLAFWNLKNIQIKAGAKVIGIKESLESWEDFIHTLKKLELNHYQPLDNILPNRLIIDGYSYRRCVALIKYLCKKQLK